MLARKPGAGLALLLAISACGDNMKGPLITSDPTASASAAEIRAAEQSLKVVARAVAVALEDRQVRLAVRDAMRDSPWDVHQVSLQELVSSELGAGLLTAASRAAGETPADFQSRLGALPDLDFYFPSRDDRRSWKGTGGVVITAGINLEASDGFSFSTNGQQVASPRQSGRPVLLLHPAEPRGRRNAPQATGVGEVIQSEGDGETAVRFYWTDAEGRTSEIDADEVLAARRESIVASSLSFGDSTYLDYAYFSSSDSGDDLELTFYAKFYRPDGTYLGEWTYVNYSFPYRQHWWGHVPLLLPTMPDSSAAYVELRIREEDGWLNPDEWYGPRVFTWVDRAQIRRLDVQGGTDYADIELDWVRRPAPVLTSVYVAPTTVFEGSSGSSYAEARDQYGWRMPNQTVSSWWTDHSAIATASSSGSTTASITGVSQGSTVARASIGSITGSASVYVEYPSQNCDPNLDPFCPM